MTIAILILKVTYKQGGLITITGNNIPAVAAATAKFSANVTDPKAGVITTYNFLLGQVMSYCYTHFLLCSLIPCHLQPGISQLLFYDGPTPPAGIFDDFLAIPYFTKDVSTRDFSSLVQASPANATYGQRCESSYPLVLNKHSNSIL